MRIIAEIPHPYCKISVFYMNQKYIIKFEKGNLEQSYKISELDFVVTGIEDIKKIVDEKFMVFVLTNFESMQQCLNSALKDY